MSLDKPLENDRANDEDFGLDKEETGSTDELSGPFDPNKIDVDISVVNLGSLLEQLEYGEIDLQPEFQRSSNIWNPMQKSRLIESILLGLPLPSFYFSQDPISNNLVVVDGLQRLFTLKEFWLEKSLKLQKLQFLKHLEGFSVDQLDRVQIRRIKGLKVTTNTLRKGTPTNVKYVIFQRVNTAGVPLTPQEMRHALNQGQATKLLMKMVESQAFKLATDGRISKKRMLDMDFANRFLAFYLNRENYRGELDAFMNDVLETINRMSLSEVEEIYQAFIRSMDCCYQLLGSMAFRRPDPEDPDRYLKINKSIFEVLSVSLAHLTIQEQEMLLARKDLFGSKIYELFIDSDFVKSITSGTAKIPQVNYRFRLVYELINYVLK